MAAGASQADQAQGAPPSGATQGGATQASASRGSSGAGSSANIADQIDASLTERSQRAPLTFSVTPFLGFRFGGTFEDSNTGSHVSLNNHGSFALALDLSPDGNASQYELFYSRESTSLGAHAPVPTDVVVEYLQIGGTAEFENAVPPVRPYLIGAVGGTLLDAGAGNRQTSFSASIGVGVRYDLEHHLALRMEARGYFTLLNSSSSVFCSSGASGGVCTIHARGSSFVQADILAGLSYSF